MKKAKNMDKRKYTAAEIKEIKRLKRSGATYKEIREHYGISEGYAWRVVNQGARSEG